MAVKSKKVVLGCNVSDALSDIGAYNYFMVDHSAYPSCDNLLHVSRKDPGAKELVVALANAGFSLYKSEEHVSKFVRNSEIANFWHRVKEGDFLTSDGLVYQVDLPANPAVSKLLVVFSSIGEDIFMSSLMRMFTFNFKSIAKYIPADAAVLRIADIGSVVGSFYLNNNSDRTFGDRVTALIHKVSDDLRVSAENVTLYGASKGGTAALYHGVTGGFNAVVVDPIVSDEYYERVFADSHFTQGTFPETKQQTFSRILESDRLLKQKISIIYSARSPQYSYIGSIVRESKLGRQFNYLNSLNPLINDHPDVGVQTVNIAVMLINMSMYHLKPDTYSIEVV